MSIELSPEDFQRIVVEVCRRLRDELVPKHRGTWMSVRNVRRELNFSSDDACRKWLRRMCIVGVSRYPNGRVKAFARHDVERALTDPRRRREFHGIEQKKEA